MSKKVTDLSALAVPDSNDYMLVEDVSAGASKKVLVGSIFRTSGTGYINQVSTTTPHNTGAVTTSVDITAMNLSVFTPAESVGRTLKLTAWVSSVVNASGTGTNTRLNIQTGSTVLAYSEIALPTSDQRAIGPVICTRTITAAGTIVYKLTTINSIATNVQYNAAATQPIVFLAEII